MISIITPTHDLRWIETAWQAVKAQTFTDWEWILLLNGAAQESDLPSEIRSQPNVVIIRDEPGNVGRLKRACCEAARGDYIIELDHDDELAVDCLEQVYEAFQDSGAPVFVFSQCAQQRPDGSPYLFNEAHGWRYRQKTFHGKNGPVAAMAPDSPSGLPQNIARIWYAPDHVRAWRKDAYWRVGGHNPDLPVCDDIDLICRLYLEGPFRYIPKVLYKYLVHGENTWLKNTDVINQNLMWQVYDQYIERMAWHYWKEQNKLTLDLGGAIGSPQGWTSVDRSNADCIYDLDQDWPFENNSVGALRAYDILEHLRNPIHVMNEAYRVLCHGGLFLIEVPSTDGRGAFQDPTHVSYWNSNSFWYYTREQQQQYVRHAGVDCRFQTVRVLNYFPTQWHRDHNIVYLKIHLAAIKDGPRLHGVVEV